MDASVQAFFSYANADVATARKILEGIQNQLEKLVNCLGNKAKLRIWQDKEDLRTGQRTCARLDEALLTSDILIVLLTPSWIESPHCRREYMVFSEKEPEHGEYVIPIVGRSLETRRKHFSAEEAAVATELFQRQHYEALETDLLAMSEDERTLVMEGCAKNIGDLVERICEFRSAALAPAQSRRRRNAEFSGVAHDFHRVDPVSDVSVVYGEASSTGPRDVLAQASFVERLFVESNSARIEFGVAQAYLSVWSSERQAMQPSQELRASGRLVTLRARPNAVTAALTPLGGRTSLAELCLPVSHQENLYSRVARLRASVSPIHSRPACNSASRHRG